MWCCGSCGSEGVTGKFIVSKPTSNQQFHTQKQFEAQQPAHSQAPPLRRVQMAHALASELLNVTLASENATLRLKKMPSPSPEGSWVQTTDNLDYDFVMRKGYIHGAATLAQSATAIDEAL